MEPQTGCRSALRRLQPARPTTSSATASRWTASSPTARTSGSAHAPARRASTPCSRRRTAELPRAAAPAPVVPARRVVTGGGSSLPAVQALLRVLGRPRRRRARHRVRGRRRRTCRDRAFRRHGRARSRAGGARARPSRRLRQRRGAAGGLLRPPARPRPVRARVRGRRRYDWEFIVGLLEPGGIVVKDDLTPGREVDGDPVREFLLRDRRLVAAEILTAPAAARRSSRSER